MGRSEVELISRTPMKQSSASREGRRPDFIASDLSLLFYTAPSRAQRYFVLPSDMVRLVPRSLSSGSRYPSSAVGVKTSPKIPLASGGAVQSQQSKQSDLCSRINGCCWKQQQSSELSDWAGSPC